MRVRYGTLDWLLHTRTCSSRCRSVLSASSILTPTTGPPWLSLALTHWMKEEKCWRQNSLRDTFSPAARYCTAYSLIDETMTLSAACRIRNPFTQFEHVLINIVNHLYLTVSTSTHSYFQLQVTKLKSYRCCKGDGTLIDCCVDSVHYMKRPGATLDAGCVIAKLHLDDPSRVQQVGLSLACCINGNNGETSICKAP